jgi:rhodanese-related sulfurtransferase
MLAGCRSWRNRERPPFRKVSPPVAFEILRDSPDVLILDLRTREEYLGDTGHIYRARNIPLERLPDRLLEIAPFRDDTFLVYCRDGDTCGEEGMAILISSGFENAILVDGGIDGWIRYGFRTVLPVLPEKKDGAGDEAGEGLLLPR